MTGTGFTPTVDQIVNDTITQISTQYWAQSDDEATTLKPFDPVLIDDIYANELVKTKFNLRRIMLLEFSQYLENYLWKNYEAGRVSRQHVISIAIMINEKFRERVFAWGCFKKTEQAQFADFFENILKLVLDKFESTAAKVKLSYQEQTILIKFLDNCINSLEFDMVRTQVQRICGLPMWVSLSENRREYEFKKFPKLKKFWKAIEKNDKKLSKAEQEKVVFERTFFKSLIQRFLEYLNTFDRANSEAGEVFDEKEYKFKMHYLERVLELLIDLEALLPTRRFFNTLLEDSNLLIHCYMSALHKMDSFLKIDTRLFNQLVGTLKFYTAFEINDQTGEAKTESECQELHYEKVKSLQKGVFKYFKEDLLSFSLTNIATIDKRETLIKHLDSLTQERLYALGEYLHLVPTKPEENEISKEYRKELLLELIIWHMERRSSQIDDLNSMPLFPSEQVIWDENLVPTDFQQQSTNETCLALPKLGLQFLTLHDYLLRNFNLFRLEAAYELRQDIEDACIRMRPYYAYEDQEVRFNSWSRMAQPIVSFNIVEIGKANVGEDCPSRVRADVSIDTEYMKSEMRGEWDALRKHDIGFLVTLKPVNTKEQKYDSKLSFLSQMGGVIVRGCEVEGLLNEDGKLINEEQYNGENKKRFSDSKRTFRVFLDPNQYKQDTDASTNDPSVEDVYSGFNVFVRRNPKTSNFKAVLECIRDLLNTKFVVPEWLRDLLLGYGDPAAANYTKIKQPIANLDFNDTFLSYDHLVQSFPDHQVELANQKEAVPPFKLTFNEFDKGAEKKILVNPYKKLNRGPYPYNQPKANTINFTPTQVEAIKSGMQPGLTIVVGPPGTGKTDVAVQIISNIYHNFPDQKTLIVTHSNQALNQLFEKIMGLDIDERHLLRLGHGEDSLETDKDFSRYGRVNYVLATRLQLLDEVDRLQKSFHDVMCETAAYSCETALQFYLSFVHPRWDDYTSKITRLVSANKVLSKSEEANPMNIIETLEKLFPFAEFYSNAPQPLFQKKSFEEDYEVAKGCFRYIRKIFKQLEEFRAFELIRNGADRAEYLLVKEAKIIAMTCTHAALKRKDLVKFNFQYDNILMEEAAQILEIETFIPLLLQNPDHNGHNRLKRWIMIGDHHQLPPIIKNMTFQKYSNMEQSLFTRFVKLGIPTVDLDAQGRCRASLCDLFKWRYKNLGSLKHVNDQSEFRLANAGLVFDYQLINVEDYNGVGESEPQPHFYQNLAEAEYIVALFMYMRLIGYPAERISILTTYNGQKTLIREVMRKRCASNPLIGNPKKITTVDKYQGQQNDFILLSLVKTKNIGHLRDVRRLIVAMSRARLGLYIFARAKLFRSCFELTPVFNKLLKRPVKLQLVADEQYPCQKRDLEDRVEGPLVIEDMPQMAQYVFDFYQAKLKFWNKLKNVSKEAEDTRRSEDKVKANRERLAKLDEEEKTLREKLGQTIEAFEAKKRLNIEDHSSSSSSSEDEDQVVDQDSSNVAENNNDKEMVEAIENEDSSKVAENNNDKEMVEAIENEDSSNVAKNNNDKKMVEATENAVEMDTNQE